MEAWAWANESWLVVGEVRHGKVPHPKLRRQFVTAFQGAVRVHFPDQNAAAALAPVVRLAEWTGTGMKTMYGFGETLVLT